MIRRPPRSTLFPYNDALPICERHPAAQEGDQLGNREDHVGGHPVLYDLVVENATDGEALRVRHLVAGGDIGTHRGEGRSEEHTSELQSRQYLVCRLLLEKKTT